MLEGESSKENLSTRLFKGPYPVKLHNKQKIANIYQSKPNNSTPPIGTLYTIHGYGGSPKEFCLKQIAELGLKNNFNVVAIESIPLSATAGGKKQLSEMTLDNHRNAIAQALLYCRYMDKIEKTKHNAVFAHSMGARALSDLLQVHCSIRNYFEKLYALNPFFLPPQRLQDIYGTPIWNRMATLPRPEVRKIEGVEYTIPRCTGNYYVDLPKEFGAGVNEVGKITELVSSTLSDADITFVTGEMDLPQYNNYKLNMHIYDNLTIKNKQCYTVPGADHYFENRPAEYYKVINKIIADIRDEWTVNAR